MNRKRKKKKQEQMMKRLLIISLCVLMVVLSIYLIKLGESFRTEPSGTTATVTGAPTPPPTTAAVKATSTPVPTSEPVLEIALKHDYAHTGETKEEVFAGTAFSYAVCYPVYENDKISTAAEAAVEQLISENREEAEGTTGAKCRLWIDYEDGVYRALTSIVFHITKEVNGKTTEEIVPWLFNEKKGEAYEEAEKLFGSHAYAYVSGKIAKAAGDTEEDAVQTDAEQAVEYLYYLLTEDGAKFFYRYGGEDGNITIPYVELHTYMAVTVNGTVRADNIRELDPNKPMIALTYDDGPHTVNTKRLLGILEKYHARATFFELGDRLTWNGSKECAQMVYEAGHELASHTWSHSNLTRLSEEDLQKEFVKTRELIYEYTGEYPTFVRAPGGNVNDTVKAYAFAPLVNWSVDSRDWESRNCDMIVEQVKKGARKNRIILMHDIHTCTIDASEILIPMLIEQGYQLVTLSELFYYNEVEPENGVLYHAGDY